MKKLLLIPVVALSLWAPALSQPWLDCAQKYLPAVVEPEMRQELKGALVHAYARHGEFAQAQALIEAQSGHEKARFGVLAALGALRGHHLEQSLRWADLYLPKEELSWATQREMTVGSDRERLLRSARHPEDAAKVLEFLRANGGVSPSALSFVLREAGGMPVAVTDFYLREFARVGDSARRVDWVQIEETAEASGAEFRPLADHTVTLLLEQRDALVDELVSTTDVPKVQMEQAMRKYAAALLARRGRFAEAAELWKSVGQTNPAEQKVYLQEQWVGGRKEALAELAALSGLEEDAKVQLTQLLFRLGRFEQAKQLDTDPEEYINRRIAIRDMARGKNIDRWLTYLGDLDKDAKPEDATLFALASDDDMPAQVRKQARALLPDESALTALCQQGLSKDLRAVAAAESARVSLMLLGLDEDISEGGCMLDQEGLGILSAISAKAPVLQRSTP